MSVDQLVPSQALPRPIDRIDTGGGPLRVLFVRPPRHYWPILNESDNFLLPLGYPALAAHLRARMENVELEILDCCLDGIGYRSLEYMYKARKPHVVCIGEKVVYGHEGFKAFALAKKSCPEAVCVAGGHLYSAMPEWSMQRCAEIDYVGRFEGEETLRELLETLRDGGDLSKVAGIVYRDGSGGFTHNPHRGLIQDLDSLAIPAYDMVDLKRYAPFGKLWPKAVTVQRSRGCVDTCNFCSWIVQEGRPTTNDAGQTVVKTSFRSKSVGRMIDEIALLYEHYGVRYLFWTDATWNVDNEWLKEFCTEIIRRDYRLGWWAFTRLDTLMQQEEKGILPLMVKAGLRHVLVGVERVEKTHYNWLNKHRYSKEQTIKAFHLLRDQYPQVFRQGTFITGLRDDTPEDIRSLLHLAHEADLDFAAFHPITPFPGTPLFDQAKEAGWLEEEEFDNFDMFYPVMSSATLNRGQIAQLTSDNYRDFVGSKPWRYAKRCFSPYKNRRDLHRWFLYAVGRTLAMDAWRAILGEKSFEGFAGVNQLWKPAWYDS